MENFTIFIANHLSLFTLLAVTLIALMVVEMIRAKRAHARLFPAEVVSMINKNNAVVIDIRNEEAFRNGHILDAVRISTEALTSAGKKLDKYKNKPVIIVCDNGVNAHKAATTLGSQGYKTFVLAGGMRAWCNADLPLVKEA